MAARAPHRRDGRAGPPVPVRQRVLHPAGPLSQIAAQLQGPRGSAHTAWVHPYSIAGAILLSLTGIAAALWVDAVPGPWYENAWDASNTLVIAATEAIGDAFSAPTDHRPRRG